MQIITLSILFVNYFENFCVILIYFFSKKIFEKCTIKIYKKIGYLARISEKNNLNNMFAFMKNIGYNTYELK